MDFSCAFSDFNTGDSQDKIAHASKKISMKNQELYRGKKITIVGLGRSGYTSACLLHELGAEVNVTDNNSNDTIKEYATRLRSDKIRVELGQHSEGFIQGNDLVILSPGVDNHAPVVLWASADHIPIISEIELAWSLCSGEIIAVTGTNGKTTVTTLIARVIAAAGKKVSLCGNIGNPFSGEVKNIESGEYVALEVSSFQLERIKKFRPRISLILNFTPDHLDRYRNIEEYLAAKKRIFMNQENGDYAILNYADPRLRSLSSQIKAEVVYFNTTPENNPNYAAVMEVAGILGINQEITAKVLQEFRGVEHRLEYVGELNGVEFINDSKATNPESTIWALGIITKPVVLIAGGRDKGLDFTCLNDRLVKRVKRLILIGETRQKMRASFSEIIPLEEAGSLREAVRRAYLEAKRGDCVLLSPMVASFDMFANFEHRGKVFKQIVHELIRENA